MEFDCTGTYSDNDCGVLCNLGGNGDEHLNVGRVAAEASDLLQRAHGRAGRSQQGSGSGERLHDVVAGLGKPLIRLGEFIRGGASSQALRRLL
jgi:hypothetical protein